MDNQNSWKLAEYELPPFDKEIIAYTQDELTFLARLKSIETSASGQRPIFQASGNNYLISVFAWANIPDEKPIEDLLRKSKHEKRMARFPDFDMEY